MMERHQSVACLNLNRYVDRLLNLYLLASNEYKTTCKTSYEYLGC